MADRLEVLQSEDKFDMTSMIDVVFLLLIYFMYLPLQQEADLPFTLPAFGAASENVVMPSEQIVEIAPDGSVSLNGTPCDAPGDVEFKELARTLARLKASADKSKISTIVSISADPDSPHQASMSVLDACVKAGIKQVSFAETK